MHSKRDTNINKESGGKRYTQKERKGPTDGQRQRYCSVRKKSGQEKNETKNVKIKIKRIEILL